MRKILLTQLALAMLIMGSATVANAQVSFGIRIGAPPVERAYRVPPQPGPDYEWIEGYWYPQGSRYVWHDGYWTRPPFAGAYWNAPYYSNGRYFAGSWQAGSRVMRHDHRWDRQPNRDENHDRGPGRDRR